MKWYFVRHGEILSNLRKVYAGWGEEPLTDRGVRQAEAVAEDLAGLKPAAIYSSPLPRTMQTAAIIGRAVGLAPVPEEGFIEIRMGPWEGMSEKAVAGEYPEEWRTWNERPDELRLEGRETLAQLRDRAMAAVARIKVAAPGDGDAVLVVTHVAVIRVLVLQAAGRPLSEYKSIEVPNCGVFPIEGL